MVKPPNILLITPPCLDPRINDQDAGIVPIGLYYIAALLIENGFQALILNMADPKTNPAEFEDIIRKTRPVIIGFSITNPSRWPAIELAQKAKSLLPDATIVFGGPAATFLYSHLFQICPELDYIITGEGEFTFLELAKTLLLKNGRHHFEKVNGLVFKKRKQIVKNPDRPRITNLDTLPHPSKYFRFQHLAMSRGCPGNCNFCGSAGFWKDRSIYSHSATWFADEIHLLYKQGVRHFFISDDTLTMDREGVLDFCRIIGEKKLQISWNAISRADYIDEELLIAMRMAGCIQISYGVESGSEKIRKALGKPIARDKIRHAFSKTLSCGILPRAYFIYGSPGETEQTIKESLDLLLDIQPLSAVFYLLTVFPGTRLYRSALQKKRVEETVWEKKIEDLPWFELDDTLDFQTVKKFGDRLRNGFYSNLHKFTANIQLKEMARLHPFHADFLSRLAMTFSHGEYAADKRVQTPQAIAADLYRKALTYAPDARAFLGLAMIAQQHRDFDKAIGYLTRGLKHFPGHSDLLTCMGICLMNISQFKKALGWFEQLDDTSAVLGHIDICRQRIGEKNK